MVGKILRMMSVPFTEESLQETIAEIDEDGSGQIEFEEFVSLAIKFTVDDDDDDVEKVNDLRLHSSLYFHLTIDAVNFIT